MSGATLFFISGSCHARGHGHRGRPAPAHRPMMGDMALVAGRSRHRSPSRDPGRPARAGQTLASPLWPVILALACAPAEPDAAVRSAIEEVSRRWERALMEGNPSEAVGDVFSEDAVRLPAGEAAVRGRGAIRDALRGASPLAAARFEIADLEVSGDLAVASGTYEVVGPDGIPVRGKFLEVWRRTEAGWRIHRVMWD